MQTPTDWRWMMAAVIVIGNIALEKKGATVGEVPHEPYVLQGIDFTEKEMVSEPLQDKFSFPGLKVGEVREYLCETYPGARIDHNRLMVEVSLGQDLGDAAEEIIEQLSSSLDSGDESVPAPRAASDLAVC